ncbi:methylated-DNA--[protein]-cysteine S-methyltransferase [Hoeflea sp. CAU 1731]
MDSHRTTTGPEPAASLPDVENCAHVETPVGTIAVVERDGRIVRLLWHSEAQRKRPQGQSEVLDEAVRQLSAYFDSDLKQFDLPLAPKGGDFEHAVQRAMQAIPYGETRTYGDIARDLGTYGQPVGQACGANPIPIIIPCHRVLSANGLGGFSGEGGVEMKISLLKHEGGYPFLL